MIKEALEYLAHRHAPTVLEDAFTRYEYYGGQRTVTEKPPPFAARSVDTLESLIDVVKEYECGLVCVNKSCVTAYSDSFDLRKPVWVMDLRHTHELDYLIKLRRDKPRMNQDEIIDILEDDLRSVGLDDLRTKLAVLRSTRSRSRDVGPMHDKGVSEFTAEAADNIQRELTAMLTPFVGIPYADGVELRLKIDPQNLTIQLYPFAGEIQKLTDRAVNFLASHLTSSLSDCAVHCGSVVLEK